jgi:hypothetical protein
MAWIGHVVAHRSGWARSHDSWPSREVIPTDGRIHRWAPIEEMEGRYLRVVLLPDGQSVHDAFFDRSFEP